MEIPKAMANLKKEADPKIYLKENEVTPANFEKK